MANTTIDTSELEYLKSCRDKLRDLAEILDQDKNDEEKFGEIKKIIKGEPSPHKSKKKNEGSNRTD